MTNPNLADYVDRLMAATKLDTDDVVRTAVGEIVDELADRLLDKGFHMPDDRDALYFTTRNGMIYDLSGDEPPSFPISERSRAILAGLLTLARERLSDIPSTRNAITDDGGNRR